MTCILHYFSILNKRYYVFIFILNQMKQNKYQIKCKKCEKNIFNIFYALTKINKSETKIKSKK